MESLLLVLLVGLALAAVRARDLLAATGILGAYSLMMALLWCVMNALDVGFTEAAVGAGISTVLLLAAIHRIGRKESSTATSVIKPVLISMREKRDRLQRGEARLSVAISRFGTFAVCLLVAAALVYGAQDMPPVGDPDSKANAHPEVARRYIERSPEEVGPSNLVTAVLGDYRGYDTMGETVVIFTAALCVLLLLREGRPRRRERGHDAE